MKLEVTVDKRALFIVAFLFVVVGSVFVYAVTPNPGHDANTVGDGNGSEVFGGKSTFAGTSASAYFFPGRLATGPNANPALAVIGGAPRDFYVKAALTGWGGIGIETNGASNSHTFIDFIHDGQIKANFDYNAYPGNDALLINSAPEALTTKVGIGTVPTTEKLEVGGNVKATGFCINSDCRTSWPDVDAVDESFDVNWPIQVTGLQTVYNLAPGLWFVTTYGITHDAADSTSYTISALLDGGAGAVSNQFTVFNHPDGTPEYSIPQLVRVGQARTLTVRATSTHSSNLPYLSGVVGYRIGP